MSKRFRVGLIGAGMVSRHHLIAWASLADDARVVAIADPSPENAMQRASEFGIGATFLATEDMLSETELDAVDIAAPRAYHADLVRLAAKNRWRRPSGKPKNLPRRWTQRRGSWSMRIGVSGATIGILRFGSGKIVLDTLIRLSSHC
jgi:hypothetical protein